LWHTGEATGDKAGTVVVAGTAVTGTGTAFVSSMAGSIFRISADTTLPGAMFSKAPYQEESVIASVTNATELVLVDSLTAASGVAYRITDPIDFGRTAWGAMRACVKRILGARFNMENRRQLEADYLDATHAARSADSPANPPRAALGNRKTVRRLRDMV
jgi:pyruvate/2-oxoglutarate/acetoin dehydrogenase E1 component